MKDVQTTLCELSWRNAYEFSRSQYSYFRKSALSFPGYLVVWVKNSCTLHALRNQKARVSRYLTALRPSLRPLRIPMCILLFFYTSRNGRRSGHWVDFLSLYRLRTDLDRARVLFDCVLRREKVRGWRIRSFQELHRICAGSHFAHVERYCVHEEETCTRERVVSFEADTADRSDGSTNEN